eukprot:TRINITY_DN60799_c0_g1_i3.p1 TRINITY_DN60799_c0_g1~~TRINITY_DN60799_c0_g1_i3.p1  ORF type:complete len:112 (+),score=16.45 TRINITY_DN60799_c0_g1_i3:183-518(+)
MLAAERGQIECLRTLLDARADPNAGVKWPAIACAAEGGRMEAVRVLMEAETDMEYWGKRALLAAAIAGKREMVQALFYKYWASRIRAAPNCSHEIVAMLPYHLFGIVISFL